jgi:hypothetical protein
MVTYRSYDAEVAGALAERHVEALARIYRARFARGLAGVVLATLAIASMAWALTLDRSVANEMEHGPAALLLMSWPAAIASYLFARVFLAAADAGREHRVTVAERSLFSMETASIALPLAGIAFAAPLTLHAGVAVLDGELRGFADWMRISAVLVGHAHLALAGHGLLFARTLHRARSGEESQRVRVERSWLGGLGVAVMCGIVPGIVLIGIPPVLVLVTGVVFIPASYMTLQIIFAHERAVVRRAFAG